MIPDNGHSNTSLRAVFTVGNSEGKQTMFPLGSI